MRGWGFRVLAGIGLRGLRVLGVGASGLFRAYRAEKGSGFPYEVSVVPFLRAYAASWGVFTETLNPKP